MIQGAHGLSRGHLAQTTSEPEVCARALSVQWRSLEERRDTTHPPLAHTALRYMAERCGIQHHPVEGMAWLVSGLLLWCCMQIIP